MWPLPIVGDGPERGAQEADIEGVPAGGDGADGGVGDDGAVVLDGEVAQAARLADRVSGAVHPDFY